METGFLAAFSKKVITTIIAVGSMFYSTIDGVTPIMSIDNMYFWDDHFIVSTVITNCYTEELDQILASGNEIPVNFDIELYREGEKEPDSTFSFFHLLQYSPIENNYQIFLSEKNEYIYSINQQQAKVLFTNIIDQRLIAATDLEPDYRYFIKITAWLDKIKLQGMEEELNLNFYWNSIKPNITSPLFSKINFQS